MAKVFSKVGSVDAAAIAADRARTAAERSGDAADIGMAIREVVRVLRHGPRRSLAEPLAVTTVDRIADPHDPAVISVCGSLVLVAAMIAAREGDAPLATERLVIADALADALGADANHR